MSMRVLELSDREEGAAFCTKLFRRCGAEVIKVEPLERARPAEHLDLYLNAGKRRVGLDLRRDHGAIEELARQADIVVTDYSNRVIERFGLMEMGRGAHTVRVSITPFGRSGPYKDWSATSATLLALGGYTWLMGDTGRAPLTMPGSYAFYQAGTFAFISGLAAQMSGRERGVEIEVSVLECLAALHQFTDTMWLYGGQVRSRHGNRWENLAPTTLLQCHDGWYGVNILQNFWFPFAHMIGHPEIAAETPLSANSGRMERQDEVEAMITEALWHRPKKRIFKEGQEVWRVPVGYAAGLRELLEDEHLRERDFWQPLPGASVDGGRPPVLTAGSPFRLVGEGIPAEPARTEPEERASFAPRPVEPAPPQSATGPAAKPLAGVRVLDLTRIWSGPVATRILGDLGAEVIKIESHDGRGGARIPGMAHIERPWNRQPLFNKLNRNKKSISVDLKAEKGREIFLRLVSISDVVIENFSARAMPSLGLSYEVMRAANDRIIYLTMPAFGLFGPYRDYIGLGPSIEPLTGMTAVMGYSDEEPRVTSKAVTDAMSGTTAAAAVLTALARRSETGRGCLVDLSQHEAGVAFLGEYFIRAQLSGKEPQRAGNSHEEWAPHGVYRCEGDDEWIAIAVRGEDDWRALCEVIQRPELPRDPRFASAESRRANRSELDGEIESRTVAREKRELEAALQERGVAAGAVLTPPEWLSDRHLRERGFFVELEHKETGVGTWDGSPLRFDGGRGYDDWAAAPCLGEDNRGLLVTLLGMSDREVEALYSEGVLAEAPPRVEAAEG